MTFNASLAFAAAASPTLRAALALAGVDDLTPADIPRLVVANPAARFTLDVLLRTFLWTDDDGPPRERWIRALCADGPGSLLHALASPELQTHPTELVARHAAELLGARPEAERWKAQSLAVSNASPPGSAIRRFAEFTARLGKPAVGPPGCVTNPTFEYR